MKTILCALALFASLFMTLDASANGGLAVRQRIVTRQRIVQPVVRQRVVVQQVVAPAIVSQAIVTPVVTPIYAAPVVQSFVVPQAYSAPVVQQFSNGCGYSQSLRLRSSAGGCSQFFIAP